MGTLTPQCPVANPTIVAVVLYELIGATAQPQSLEIVVACSVDQSASASLRGRQTVTKPHQFVTTRVWHIDRALRPAESWQNRGRGRGRNVTIPTPFCHFSAAAPPVPPTSAAILPQFCRNSAAMLPVARRKDGSAGVSAAFLSFCRFSAAGSFFLFAVAWCARTAAGGGRTTEGGADGGRRAGRRRC